MDQLKNFIEDGNVYRLKKQYGFMVVLCGAFLAIALFGFIKAPGSSFKWWMLGIAVVLFISFQANYLIIDLNTGEMRAKASLISPGKTILLKNIDGFTVHKMKQYGVITTNVALLVRYIQNDKEKQVQLAQHFFTKPIQSILNDIDEIIAKNDQGKI